MFSFYLGKWASSRRVIIIRGELVWYNGLGGGHFSERMRLYEEIQQFVIVLDWKMLIILSLQQWKADLPDLFYSFENYYEGYLLFSQHQEY